MNVTTDYSAKRTWRVVSFLIIALLPLLAAQCSRYPTESSGRDLAEQEAVWQYLKTYSIYQDSSDNRVPANAFNASSPAALFSAIHDTLSGGGYPVNTYIGTYTGYDSEDLYSSAGMASVSFPYGDTTVYWERINDSTAYIGISGFDANTYYEFSTYIDSLNSCHNIIFDLRYNGGGSLSTLDSIIQSVLPHGKPYILERYRNYDSDKHTASTVNWDTLKTSYSNMNAGNINSAKRFVVMANRESASAAELFVAAMKDGFASVPGKVTFVGDTTYGKGMGQVIIPRQIWGKINLKITFLLIKGVSNRIGNYHRKGIVPDILVPGYYLNNTTLENQVYNAQSLAALRVFNPSATLPLSKTRGTASGTIVLGAGRTKKTSSQGAYIVVSPDKLPIRQ